MQNFAHSPWSTNVFAGKMTSCMPLIAHLGKPGPHIFRWFLVQKHINSKKPISFFLNSMSSTIWPHFLLFLSVTLVGSPFSGLACAVQPVAFASVLFLSCQDHLSSFLHWVKGGKVPPDHLPCRLCPPSCWRSSYAGSSLGKKALALSWLLSHHVTLVSLLQGQGWHFSHPILSPVPYLKSTPHTLPKSSSSPKSVLAYFPSKPLL